MAVKMLSGPVTGTRPVHSRRTVLREKISRDVLKSKFDGEEGFLNEATHTHLNNWLSPAAPTAYIRKRRNHLKANISESARNHDKYPHNTDQLLLPYKREL